MGRLFSNTSGNTWRAVYTANASDTDGAVTYSIAFSDTSGNAGTAVTSGSGSVTTDTTAPTLSMFRITVQLRFADELTLQPVNAPCTLL